MIWVLKYEVTLMSVVKSFVSLNIIAILVFIVNKINGSNYT
ncbi:TMEM164 family acyltransferase [Halalkalibacterium ligniniphilum]